MGVGQTHLCISFFRKSGLGVWPLLAAGLLRFRESSKWSPEVTARALAAPSSQVLLPSSTG